MLVGLSKLILKPIKTNRMKNNEQYIQYTGNKCTWIEKGLEEFFLTTIKE